MALTTYTLTGGLDELTGAPLDVTGMEVVVKATEGWIPDETSGSVRKGEFTGTIDAETGTFTVAGIPATTDGYPLYEVEVTERRSTRPIRVTRKFAMDQNLTIAQARARSVTPQVVDEDVAADIHGALAAVPVVQALKADVLLAKDYIDGRVVEDLGTTDGQTKALIETPSSETAQALSATFVATVGRPTGDAVIDTAAIQAAHDAAPGNAVRIQLQPGTYALNPAAPLVFTKKVSLVGLGGARTLAYTGGVTTLTFDSATGTAITAGYGFHASDLLLRNIASSTPTAGCGIAITGDLAKIDCDISGFYTNLKIDGALADIGGNNHNPAQYGIEFANAAVPDAGDHKLTGWLLTGSRNAQAAIYYRSGGGLKCYGLKINKGGTGRFVHFLEMALEATTSDLLIDNACSFENCTGSGIYLHQAGASTAQFINVGIYAQIAPYTAGARAIEIAPANGTVPFQNIDIDILAHGNGGGVPAVTLVNVTNAKVAGVFSGWSAPTSVTSSTSVNVPVTTETHWIPAQDFAAVVGSPALSGALDRWASWLLDSAASEYVGATLAPLTWRTYAVDVYWANAGGGSGDVVLGMDYDHKSAGGTLSLAGTSVATVTVAADAQSVMKVTTLSTGITVTPNALVSLRVSRRGANAADTLGNDIELLGVMLWRVN